MGRLPRASHPVMGGDDTNDRCVWRVLRADGESLGEGAFYEADYARAVTRAKTEAAAVAHPGATLRLEVHRIVVVTLLL